MIEIDGWEVEPVKAEDLEIEVRKLVEANPDFIYAAPDTGWGTSCLYTHAGGVGGCLIGQALAAMGRRIPFDSELNASTDVGDLAYKGLIEGEYSWLFKVQSEQDGKIPWGEAVETADRRRKEAEEDREYSELEDDCE